MDSLIWRAKIGLIVNSGQIVTEPRYYQAAPSGVGFFTTRLLNPGGGLQGLSEMEKGVFRAVEELADAQVDAIAYCCTVSGALRGLERDRAFCKEVETKWGIPTTSTMLAAVEAMHDLGIQRVVVASPYPEDHLEPERAYLEAAAIQPLALRGMELPPERYAHVPPKEIFSFCLDIWNKQADGLFLSCMNFDGMSVAQALEDHLGRPVVTSHSATLYRALALAHVGDTIRGYGRLLEKPRL